jgi:UDP-N-acetylmuramoyl-L-alanyl-D-glutamate--2,6-diaminopimelate ligase
VSEEPRPLLELVEDLPDAIVADPAGDASRVLVADVTHDSRQVRPGTLFCCVRGGKANGADFAPAAVEAGAVALLVEEVLDLPVPQIVVPSVRTAEFSFAGR